MTSALPDTKDPIARALTTFVDAGSIPGAVTLVWHDEVIQSSAVGWRDIDGKLPMERNTLFRIASMTKPLTSAAALMLFEEGRFALDDPIVRWAPEFSDMRTLLSPEGPIDATRPAERLITFRDLLTHRAGFTYGDFHTGPIAEAYAAKLGGDIDSEVAPDEWIARLAAIPLVDEPGAAFHYGRSTDLLGLLISRMEDKPLEEVLRQRLFDPLGMEDTSFTVPPSKRHRRALAHGFDDDGQLTVLVAPPGGAAQPERPDDMLYASGGQGLWSTVDDYLAFARMLVEGGEVGGTRILRAETIELMTSNQLTASQRAGSKMLGMPIFADGHGFGMGVAVVVEPGKAPATPCGGGAGAFGWPGSYGGWWRVDPGEGSIMILLTHSMVTLDQLAVGIGLGVYAAIDSFQEAASDLIRSNP